MNGGVSSVYKLTRKTTTQNTSRIADKSLGGASSQVQGQMQQAKKPAGFVDFRCEFDLPKFCDLSVPDVDDRFSTIASYTKLNDVVCR